MNYDCYRVNLAAPPTSVPLHSISSNFVRQGFVLALTLDDGSTGFGEVTSWSIYILTAMVLSKYASYRLSHYFFIYFGVTDCAS